VGRQQGSAFAWRRLLLVGINSPYSLRDETDSLVGLIALAARRFACAGQHRPVDVVELGYWLEGARLGVWFVADPEYGCYGQAPYTPGYTEEGKRSSYCAFFEVPSWNLLMQRDEPFFRLAVDGSGTPIVGPEAEPGVDWITCLVKASGRNLARMVAERHGEMFAGLRLADPFWVIVFEDEDSQLAWVVRVAGGRAEILPDEEVCFP
jgi:hypothetical protein